MGTGDGLTWRSAFDGTSGTKTRINWRFGRRKCGAWTRVSRNVAVNLGRWVKQRKIYLNTHNSAHVNVKKKQLVVYPVFKPTTFWALIEIFKVILRWVFAIAFLMVKQNETVTIQAKWSAVKPPATDFETQCFGIVKLCSLPPSLQAPTHINVNKQSR